MKKTIKKIENYEKNNIYLSQKKPKLLYINGIIWFLLN